MGGVAQKNPETAVIHTVNVKAFMRRELIFCIFLTPFYGNCRKRWDSLTLNPPYQKVCIRWIKVPVFAPNPLTNIPLQGGARGGLSGIHGMLPNPVFNDAQNTL
ncbi:MAG: hypothetical protein ACK41Q_05880 [Candidatus Brocadia sp.]